MCYHVLPRTSFTVAGCDSCFMDILAVSLFCSRCFSTEQAFMVL